MRGGINDCPNTFKQMLFLAVMWEVDSFRYFNDIANRLAEFSFAKRMTKLTNRFYFEIFHEIVWNCV